MKLLIILWMSLIPVTDLDDIMQTLKMVESRNKTNLVGDNGKAFGVLQIHNIAVKEVNYTYGTDYNHYHMFDEEKSEEVFRLVMRKGIKMYKDKHGKDPTEQDIVRMWNGGIYTGYRNPKTYKYYLEYLKFKGKNDAASEVVNDAVSEQDIGDYFNVKQVVATHWPKLLSLFLIVPVYKD